nr:zinc finger CCCH domain-containing protein 43 isoform X1 [Tanacetum cinerariifolium]
MVNTGDEGIKNKFFCDLERLLFPQEPEVDGLVQDFQNVGLESSQTDCSLHDSSDSGYNGDDSNEDSNMKHPIQPHAEDCSFFIKTGTCKFGPKCKFNHPVSTKYMDDCEFINGNGVGSPSKIPSEVKCKFYSAGVCKYGQFCRFSHPKSEAEKYPLELNVLGLPKRLESSVVKGESICNHREGLELTDAGYVLHYSEATQLNLSVPMITADSFMYMDQNCVLDGYQAPACMEMWSSSSPPAANVEIVEDYTEDTPKRQTCILNDVGLPIRPGKNACWNLKNLGLCKLGRTCAFDHPKKHSSAYGSTSESLSSGKTRAQHRDKSQGMMQPFTYTNHEQSASKEDIVVQKFDMQVINSMMYERQLTEGKLQMPWRNHDSSVADHAPLATTYNVDDMKRLSEVVIALASLILAYCLWPGFVRKYPGYRGCLKDLEGNGNSSSPIVISLMAYCFAHGLILYFIHACLSIVTMPDVSTSSGLVGSQGSLEDCPSMDRKRHKCLCRKKFKLSKENKIILSTKLSAVVFPYCVPHFCPTVKETQPSSKQSAPVFPNMCGILPMHL